MRNKALYLISGMIIFVMIGVVTVCIINNQYNENDGDYIMTALITNVHKTGLEIEEVKNKKIYNIPFSKEGNIGYEQGQEIKIWYDGTIIQTIPESIEKVNKIEIVRENE